MTFHVWRHTVHRQKHWELPYLSQWAGTGSPGLAEILGSYVQTAAGETPAIPTCVLKERRVRNSKSEMIKYTCL